MNLCKLTGPRSEGQVPHLFSQEEKGEITSLDQEVIDFYAETESAKLEVIEDQGDYEINYTDKFAEARS